MAVKLMIFDLDDTLYPEEQFVFSGFRVVAKTIASKHGLEEKKIFNILKKDYKNGLRKRNFDVLIEKLALNEKPEKLVTIYRHHKPDIHLYPCIRKLLQFLSCHFKMALATAGLKHIQQNKINRLNVGKYFDLILIERTRARVESIQEILKKIDANPQETIYIDNDLGNLKKIEKLGVRVQTLKW